MHAGLGLAGGAGGEGEQADVVRGRIGVRETVGGRRHACLEVAGSPGDDGPDAALRGDRGELAGEALVAQARNPALPCR